MSECIVQVATVDKIEAHPNADRLEVAQILGWQIVVQKESYKAGDLVVYFPPDTIISHKLGDEFGSTKYLKEPIYAD